MIEKTLFHPSRRGLLVGGAASLVLAGCSGLIGPGDPPQLYLLKPTGGASTDGPSVPWQLSVSAPTASDHLDSRRIALVQSDMTADYYANSAWTDLAPLLIQTALVAQFESSGRISAVAADSDGFHSDYVLQMDLRDFSAHYEQVEGIPSVVVHIEAKLAPSRTRDIVANLKSVHKAAASANTVPAVVQAFDQALGETLAEIVNWALAVPGPVKAHRKG